MNEMEWMERMDGKREWMDGKKERKGGKGGREENKVSEKKIREGEGANVEIEHLQHTCTLCTHKG